MTMTMTMTMIMMMMMMMMILMLASAAMTDQRLCEMPENPLIFSYTCISEEVELCVKGRRLKVPQSDCNGVVDEDQICVPCEEGTFMDVNNYCDTCKPWTICDGDRMEDPNSPHSATKDRTCIRRPPPVVTPSQCPPCETVTTPPPCPACPECPTTDTPSTFDPLDGKWTSYFPSTDATPPRNFSTHPDPSTNETQTTQLQDENKMWKAFAIFFFVLAFIQFIALLYVCCWCCRRKGTKPLCVKDVECGKDKKEDAVRYDKANGSVTLGSAEGKNGQQYIDQGTQTNEKESGFKTDSGMMVCLPEQDSPVRTEDSVNHGNLPSGSSTDQTEGDNILSSSKSASSADGNSPNKLSSLHSQSKPVGHSRNKAGGHGDDTPRSSKPRHKKIFGRKKSTPSLQPLLASLETKSLQPNTMPTNEVQRGGDSSSPSRSVLPAVEKNPQDKASPLCDHNEPAVHKNNEVDSHSVDQHHKPLQFKKDYDEKGNTESMQPLLPSQLRSNTCSNSMPTNAFQQNVPSSVSHNNAEPVTNGEAIHNAPTAIYQPSLYQGKSLTAYDKTEGSCSVVTDCSEWHIDFVKDEISIENHMDFFAKLGVSSKRIRDTKYDNRAEGIREQMRIILIRDFLGRSEDVSINKLLTALDASGNKDVTRDFKKKFNVSCC